jgi:hypothetical protein
MKNILDEFMEKYFNEVKKVFKKNNNLNTFIALAILTAAAGYDLFMKSKEKQSKGKVK